MANGSILQVTAAFIALCLVLHIALGMQPGQSGLNSNIAGEYHKGIYEMLIDMDRTIDPCEDFYNFACGSWLRRHSFPDDMTHTNQHSLIHYNLSSKIKILLEERIKDSDEESAVKAKTLYQSCINKELIEKRGSEPLIKLLNSKFGGWPLLGSMSTPTDRAGPSSSAAAGGNLTKSPMDWVQLMGILRTYNYDIIIGQIVEIDEDDLSKHIIRMYPASLGMPLVDHYNPSSPQFKAYWTYLLKTAQLLSANNANLISDIKDILQFEIGLADIFKKFHLLGNQRDFDTNIAVLQGYTKAINWDIYLEHAFPGMQDVKLQKIKLFGSDFHKAISDLIARTSNNTTVVNYLLWRFVKDHMQFLGGQFAEIQREFESAIDGPRAALPRYQVCTELVDSKMGMAVGSLYAKRHFDDKFKQEAQTMVTNIRQAFLEVLHEVDWMDDETRRRAILKANSMTEYVGVPEWTYDSAQLEEEYRDLNFDPYSYFENIIQIRQSYAKANRSKAGRKPTKHDWSEMPPNTVNAYYSLTRNHIQLPAGILQEPFFHKHYPKSLNYGSLGSSIGHEITHGFDNKGKLYDHLGDRQSWWTPITTDRFNDRAQCMIDQYNAYKVDVGGRYEAVDGLKTLNENLADITGIKVAYKAYLRYVAENPPEPVLPIIYLNHNQMFFIKVAQKWCENISPQYVLYALKNWEHSPGRFRVIGALSNLEEFSQAFGCSVGSPMNPAKKCKVW